MSSKIKFWMDCFWGFGPSQKKIVYEICKECPDDFEIVSDFCEADVTCDLIIGDVDRENLVHPAEKDWNEQVKFRAYSGLYQNSYLVLCNVIDSPFYRHVFQDALLTQTYINKNQIPVSVNDGVYLRAPLGVNAGEWRGTSEEKQFMIYCFGSIAQTESIDIVFEAIREASHQTGKPMKMLHTGNPLGYDQEHYAFAPFTPPNDANAVPTKYSYSYFASALRRDAEQEGGFELANLEAPLCGCRPITYSIEPFENWFKDTSLFVSLDKTKDDLVKIFSETALGQYEKYAVTTEHKTIISTQYSWYSIVENFWQRLRANIQKPMSALKEPLS